MTERTKEQLGIEIAERLFEWKRCTCPGLFGLPHWKRGNGFAHYDHKTLSQMEPYADDCNAALGLVVDDMLGKGYSFECGKNNRGWWAVFKQPLYVYADELPRAICLAAWVTLDAEEVRG